MDEILVMWRILCENTVSLWSESRFRSKLISNDIFTINYIYMIELGFSPVSHSIIICSSINPKYLK